MVGRPGHELFGKFNLVPFRERPAQNLRIAQRGFTGSISETEPNKEKKNKREGRKGPGGGDGGRNQNLDEPHREIGSQEGATARGQGGASPTRPTKP